MTIYAFSIVSKPVTESLVDALYGHCDDCGVSMQPDQCYASLHRDAESLEQAINAAIHDLRRIGIEPAHPRGACAPRPDGLLVGDGAHASL